MALYTGKGDDGSTYVYDTQKGMRISKNSPIAEALGASDSLNSYLGLCKVESENVGYIVRFGEKKETFQDIVHWAQENLFIVQAELAGADKKIRKNKVTKMEKIIHAIDDELPEIKTFFISGGTELASRFDYARTLARTFERRLVWVHESKERKIGKQTLRFANRLSTLLYALARYSNFLAKKEETPPTYK